MLSAGIHRALTGLFLMGGLAFVRMASTTEGETCFCLGMGPGVVGDCCTCREFEPKVKREAIPAEEILERREALEIAVEESKHEVRY